MITPIVQRYELLPRPDYPNHVGTTRQVYSSAGQVYQVRSIGSAWVADSLVHQGSLATLPAANSVPPYARAIVTDVRNVELYTDGAAWRPTNGHAVLSQLEADTAPSTNPGTTERTAATATIGAPLLRVGAELRLQLAAEKIGGSVDTLTISAKANAVLIYQSTLAAANANFSADLRFLIPTTTTIARRGHGDASTTWGGKSSTARPGAGAINDVTSASNAFSVTFTMATGATEYGRLTAFGVELLS